MSQQVPAVPPSLSFLHKNKSPYTGTRSGILERHTYKTDTGKLLNNTSVNKTLRTYGRQSTSTKPKPFRRSTPEIQTPNASFAFLANSPILFRAKSKTDISNQDKNKDIRTEHCDSTTDIVEHHKQQSPTISEVLRRDHNYPKPINNANNTSTAAEVTETIHIDSDSDCEIIDIKDNDEKLNRAKTQLCLSLGGTDIPRVFQQVLATDSVKTKVLAWFADTEKLNNLETTSDTVVISDSEEDTKDVVKSEIVDVVSEPSTEIYKDIDRYSPNTSLSTKQNVGLIRRSEIPELQTFGEVIARSEEPSSSSSSLKEIFPPTERENTPLILHSPKETTAPREIAAYPPTENQNISCQQSAQSIVLEKTPVKQKSPIKEKSFVLSSPDTAKTELYSYLKINTNPASQKAEAVTKNRRSNRVKNLTLQIEKAKELTNIRNEVEQDVRKIYMKCSQELKFTSTVKYIPTHISYFDDYVTNYFRIENIDYLKESILEANSVTSVKRKRSSSNSNKKPEQRKKIKYVKKGANRVPRRQTRGKLQELRKLQQKTTLNHPITKIQKQRFRSRRKLRNTIARITRNTIDDIKVLSQKMLNITRAQLRSKINKMKKVKARQKLITSEQDSEENTSTEEQSNDKHSEKSETSTCTTSSATVIQEIITTPVSTEKNSTTLVTSEQFTSTMLLQNNSASTSFSHINETNPGLPSILAQKLSFALHSADNNNAINTPNVQSSKTVEHSHSILQTYLTAHSLRPGMTSPRSIPKIQSVEKVQMQTTRQCSTNINLQPQIIIKISTDLQHKAASLNSTPEPLKSVSPECIGFEQDNTENLIRDTDMDSYKSGDTDKNLESSGKSNASSRATNLSPVNAEETENDFNTDDQNSNSSTETQNQVQSETITKNKRNYIPLDRNIKSKSFHKSLLETNVKPKCNFDVSEKSSLFDLSDSDSSISSPKNKLSPGKKSQTHVIDINESNGAVFNAYYVHNMLIIVQTQLITFWKQTALGNILGVQTMWIPSGNLQRIVLDSGCVNRRSSEMTLNVENSIAYIELWTKEHKCQYRECPIADVFATIYFYKGHGQPDKKVLQLENIKGYGNDVRFAVATSARAIVVSWCDRFSKPIKTLVRIYELAPDFQMVSSVKEMESVSHYISSLHNIQGCENLVLGADNDKISIWNLTHGYLVITLDLSEGEIPTTLQTRTICLYAQCDSGFLFLVQQINVGLLRLVAVNGITQGWKQLHSYDVPACYEKLLGVIVESGVLMTCYTNGFLCWNMHTGHIIAEIDTSNDQIVLPCNKHVVVIKNYNVTVQHVLSYVLTHDW